MPLKPQKEAARTTGSTGADWAQGRCGGLLFGAQDITEATGGSESFCFGQWELGCGHPKWEPQAAVQNGVHKQPYLHEVFTSSQTGLPSQGLSMNNQTAVKNHGLPSLGSPAFFQAQPGTSWGTGHRNPAVQRPSVGERVTPQAPAQQMKEGPPGAHFTPSYTRSPRGSSFLVNFTSLVTATAMSLPAQSHRKEEGRTLQS